MNRTDTYSLAGSDRACVLTCPPDLTADEVAGVTDWLQMVVWKLGKVAAGPAPPSPSSDRLADEVARLSRVVAEELGRAAGVAHLCRNEVADTDAALVEANERCARLRVELEEQKKLVTTLADRVAAQSELLSQRAAKPKGADDGLPGYPFSWPSPDPAAPQVTVIDDPEADLPEFFVEQAPDLPAVTEAAVEPQVMISGAGLVAVVPPALAPPASARKRADVGHDNRLAVARALLAGPLTATELHAATGVPKGTLSGLLPAPVHGWWKRSRHDRGASYEITDAGRAALRAAGIDAPDPPAPKTTDRDRARCQLLAQEMARLVGPQPAIVLAGATGWDQYDAETCLARHPEWFARAEGSRERWKLTAQGRELADEKEAA